MPRKIFCLIMAVVMAAWTGVASAALCAKCRDLMFTESVGKCSSCGADTSSQALILCPKCSAEQHKCEHCGGPLTDAELAADGAPAATPTPASAPEPLATPAPLPTPAASPPAAPEGSGLKWQLPTDTPPAKLPEGPAGSPRPAPIEALPLAKPPTDPAARPLAIPAVPAPPARIDPTKSGVYTSGKWRFQLQITAPGTPSEGRWGWLTYDGQMLPRGGVNDYYRTPWGPIYWVDVPKAQWGMHGWMLAPLAQNPRQGQPLAMPVAKPQAAANAPAAKPQRPPTLELNKTHNGQVAKVYPGNLIVVRLAGNPTTGYQWQAAPTGAVLRLAAQPQYTPSARTPAAAGFPPAGSGGTYTFVFQVVQPGPGVLRLVYVRPWEKNKPPIDAFAVAVNALPATATVPAKPAGPR